MNRLQQPVSLAIQEYFRSGDCVGGRLTVSWAFVFVVAYTYSKCNIFVAQRWIADILGYRVPG
jgi:hypothetical protein